MLERVRWLVYSRGCTKQCFFLPVNKLIFGSLFWLIGRMQKSLCNHELFVIIVIVMICDQFSYTKSKKVPSLHVVALSYNFISMKAHFLHVLGISALKPVVYNIVIYQ